MNKTSLGVGEEKSIFSLSEHLLIPYLEILHFLVLEIAQDYTMLKECQGRQKETSSRESEASFTDVNALFSG